MTDTEFFTKQRAFDAKLIALFRREHDLDDSWSDAEVAMYIYSHTTVMARRWHVLQADAA